MASKNVKMNKPQAAAQIKNMSLTGTLSDLKVAS